MNKRLVLAFVVFGVWVVAAGLPLGAMAVGPAAGVPVKDLLDRHPGILGVFYGVHVALLGVIFLVFRDELGLWSARFRQRFAEKHPWWKKMAGLSEEKVQYYLSFEFNRKMMIVGAFILFVLGAVYVVIGISAGL